MNTPSILAKRLPWIVPQTATVHFHQLNYSKSDITRVAHFYVIEDGMELTAALVFTISPNGILTRAHHDLIDTWAHGIIKEYGDAYSVMPLEINFSPDWCVYLQTERGKFMKISFGNTINTA